MKNDRNASPINPSEQPPTPSRHPDTTRPVETLEAWSPTLGAWLKNGRVRFQVWAPQRKSVHVLLERPNQPMIVYPLEKGSDGFFSGIHLTAQAGDLYRYRLDAGNAYPDPASRFQPQGVHGPSQIIDSAAFQWTDAGWRGLPLNQLTIYELHVGTFTPEGTFESVIEKLPHLVELGINTIEIMPIADFPGLRNWGYDGVALFAPARCYGQPDDLRKLVDAAHQVGVAVLLDVVYNHLGPDGNYTGAFSPFYVTDHHKTVWGKALNFDDTESAFVREFFIQNALHWIHEYHLDGLRLDATHAIQDTSPRHFLAELTDRVQASVQGREIHLIAEDNRNEASLIKSSAEGGMGLSAVWSDDFHHEMRRILAGDADGYYVDYSDRVEDLQPLLQRGWMYSGQSSAFFQAPRGTDPSGIPLERFVFFIQNHDQIGNRAMGDRLNHKISPAAYRAASALFLCLPETPMIFMGQEWAASSPFLYFTDHDEELGKIVTKGRKEEFKSFQTFSGTDSIPDPQSPDTFRQSKLVWAEKLTEGHAGVWLFYRALLQLRRDEISEEQGHDGFIVTALGKGTLFLKRKTKDGKILLILVHLKEGAEAINLSEHPSLTTPPRHWEVLMTSEEKTYCPDPLPPVIHLSSEAPLIEFARPGLVVLKEREAPLHES